MNTSLNSMVHVLWLGSSKVSKVIKSSVIIVTNSRFVMTCQYYLSLIFKLTVDITHFTL